MNNFAFGFESASLKSFVMRYQISNEDQFGFKGKPSTNKTIVNDYNPDFSLFAQISNWLDTDFFGLSLTAKLDMPICGKNELDNLRKVRNLNSPFKNSNMRGFNINFTLAIQLVTTPY